MSNETVNKLPEDIVRFLKDAIIDISMYDYNFGHVDIDNFISKANAYDIDKLKNIIETITRLEIDLSSKIQSNKDGELIKSLVDTIKFNKYYKINVRTIENTKEINEIKYFKTLDLILDWIQDDYLFYINNNMLQNTSNIIPVVKSKKGGFKIDILTNENNELVFISNNYMHNYISNNTFGYTQNQIDLNSIIHTYDDLIELLTVTKYGYVFNDTLTYNKLDNAIDETIESNIERSFGVKAEDFLQYIKNKVMCDW